MTELVLKVDDSIAARFKQISSRKFQGNDVLAFEHALKSILSEEERDLEQIIEQIQDEIEAAGGMTDEEIDAYITAYRRQKRAEEKARESSR